MGGGWGRTGCLGLVSLLLPSLLNSKLSEKVYHTRAVESDRKSQKSTSAPYTHTHTPHAEEKEKKRRKEGRNEGGKEKEVEREEERKGSERRKGGKVDRKGENSGRFMRGNELLAPWLLSLSCDRTCPLCQLAQLTSSSTSH